MPSREQRARTLGIPPEQLPDGRGKHGHQVRGAAHPRWNNGRLTTTEGYVKIRVGTSHPLSDPNGYAYEHSLVAVSALGRYLTASETVHHRNGDRSDNRWDNLQVLSRSDHSIEHNATRERDSHGRYVRGRTPTAGGDLLDGRTWKQFPDDMTPSRARDTKEA